MMTRTFTRILVLSALAGMMTWSASAQTKCRLSVADGDPAPQLRGESKHVFSAQTTEDLTFSVFLPPGQVQGGKSVVSVRLQMPGGFLYQQLDVAVATEQEFLEGGHPTRRVKGYPFPVEAVRAVPVAAVGKQGARVRVDLDLPVAGTSIMQSSLYGRWVATPYLDANADQPCGKSLGFRIDP